MWSPDAVRALRGEAPRAEFARRLGVSPLTVYRWELPEDAAEARRPRGRAREALERVAGTGAILARVDDPVEPLLREARWEDAERELVGRLAAPGADDAPRAAATVVLARLAVMVRGDLRAALALVRPWLASLDRLPADVAAELHALAAWIHAHPDRDLFDPGAVERHVAASAHAGRPELAFLAGGAETLVALHLGDEHLLRRRLATVDAIAAGDLPPLFQPCALEVRALTCFFGGAPRRAREHHAAAAARAVELALPLWEARSLAFEGFRSLDEGVDPAHALDLARRAGAVAERHRLPPGYHLLIAGRTEAEVLRRAGRFAEAEELLMRLVDTSEKNGWTPLVLAPVLARTFAATGRLDDLRALAARFERWTGAAQHRTVRLSARLYEAWARFAEKRDLSRVAADLEGLCEELETRGGWPMLEREALVLATASRILVDELSAARRNLRKLDASLDRLPSAWFTAARCRLEGLLVIREGRGDEGLQLVEAAVAGFEHARDLPETALTRRIIGLVLKKRGHPDGARLLEEAEAEFQRLGIVPIPQASAILGPPEAAAPGSLSVAVRRLARRGLDTDSVIAELVAELSRELGAPVTVESAPSRAPGHRLDVSDGAGGRIGIVVGGSLDPAGSEVAETLVRVAELALEVAALRGRALPARDEAPEEDVAGFVAVAPVTRRIREEARRVAATRSTIIVTGESGSGKEVVARAVHLASPRADRPFVAFNCAAVPRELFESQLFGHRRGAFTGASADEPGMIRAAEGGTLFLDEVGELPLDVQPKLLRFLENGEVFPLGERRPRRVDVRVIAATHRDLGELVRAGRFREDLYWRLVVVPLHVPPLRERPADVIALARRFIRQLAPPGQAPPILGPDAVSALIQHRWPGNVRELRNVIERALAYAPLPPVLRSDRLGLEVQPR